MHVVRVAVVLSAAAVATVLPGARGSAQERPTACVPAPQLLAARGALDRARALGGDAGERGAVAHSAGATTASSLPGLLQAGHGCAGARRTSWPLGAGVPGRVVARVHSPVVRVGLLGGVADPRGEGGMWTERGANLMVMPSVGLAMGPVRVLVAPALQLAQNRAFQVLPSADGARSGFASPWYASPVSIDLPSRFGTEGLAGVTLGESAAWVEGAGVAAGVAASTLKWGPGLRGDLLFAPDAPGVPRAFVRTAQPLRTRAGAVEGVALAGTLTESPYFTPSTADDRRTLVALGATLRLAAAPSLAIGAAHARISSRGLAVDGDSTGSDQMNLLFLELGRRGAGVRGWAEVGRVGGLPSVRRFLTVPYQGIAFLAGAEYLGRLRHGSVLVSAEFANLEQPTDVRGEPIQDFYTSARVPQGWTQRGRLLGHFAGPGGQSQWVSADWLSASGRWSAGLFGERVRRNEDAFFRQYLPYQNRHDVTLRGGVRAGATWAGQELALELGTGKRLNYLFQNSTFLPFYRTVDISMPQLRLTLTPALAR